MALDPEFAAETRAWLAKADSDLRAAEWLARAEADLAGNALYHCQQAAEKSLKGLLTWEGKIFRKTHDLGELGQAVAEQHPELLALLHEATGLTQYAWKLRYPGDDARPMPDELPQAIALARRLYAEVLERLPAEVRP